MKFGFSLGLRRPLLRLPVFSVVMSAEPASEDEVRMLAALQSGIAESMLVDCMKAEPPFHVLFECGNERHKTENQTRHSDRVALGEGAGLFAPGLVSRCALKVGSNRRTRAQTWLPAPGSP